MPASNAAGMPTANRFNVGADRAIIAMINCTNTKAKPTGRAIDRPAEKARLPNSTMLPIAEKDSHAAPGGNVR